MVPSIQVHKIDSQEMYHQFYFSEISNTSILFETKQKSSSNLFLIELILISPKIKRFRFHSFKLQRLDFTSSSFTTLSKVEIS